MKRKDYYRIIGILIESEQNKLAAALSNDSENAEEMLVKAKKRRDADAIKYWSNVLKHKKEDPNPSVSNEELVRKQYEGGAGRPMSRFSRNIKIEDFRIPKTTYTKGDQSFDITEKVREKLSHYIRPRSVKTAPTHRLLSDGIRFETAGDAPFSYVTKQVGDKLVLLSIQSQIGEHEKDFNVSFNFDEAGMDKMTKFVIEQAKILLIKDAIAEEREEAAETYRRS